ncbi:histone-lysine N-methyltransferase Set8-like [Rhynchophorus ferrugineus]|uniref:histone-lysine N-methyltransferase Set8-like n=1 Tax=Rhynchophorus ferrugineus TaxID=354439 RepID=UPI003FCD0AA8
MVRATSVVTTPLQIQTRRQKLLTSTGALTSPPTPHRIELRSDSHEENNCKKPLIICQPPAPKARKKLLNSQPVNGTKQQNGNEEMPKNNAKVATKLTDYFPVRRSVRKTKTTVLEEKQYALEQLIRNEVEDGLEVRYFDGKGRGVVASKDFHKGDFVVEYSGDLVDTVEAKVREESYAENENAGCYMYYFKYNGIQYCIDATQETGRLGRLVNHSRNGNLTTKTVIIDKKPRLILIAKEDIRKGVELLYDYGDRSKESLKHHPWLAF